MKSIVRIKGLLYLALITLFLTSNACKQAENEVTPKEEEEEVIDKEEEEQTEEVDLSVSNLVLLDIDNHGNASDFKVTFTGSTKESQISEYRIFLVSENAASFDLQQAESIASSNYISMSPGDTYYVNFSETTQTANGKTIDTNSSYMVYVLSVANTEENNNSLSEASNSLSLDNITTAETLKWAGRLNTEGVSIDSQGAIYVTDLGLTGTPGNFNGTDVFKIANQGFSVFNSSLDAPLGHAFDENNILYVANFNKTELTQIGTDGVATTYLEDERLTGGDVILDKDGNIYVTVIKSSSVFKITPGKEILEMSSEGSMKSPVGIAVDDAGNVYAANFGNGNIVKITPEGTQSLLASIPSQVGYICLANDKIYATGYSSSNIYSVTLQGNVETVIGNGKKSTKEGSYLDASFDNPNGIAASADGKYLYVSQSNGLLRKIALPQ